MMEARLSEGLLNGIDHLLSPALGCRLKGLGVHCVYSAPLDSELTVVEEAHPSPLRALERVPIHVAPRYTATSRLTPQVSIHFLDLRSGEATRQI